MKVHRDIDQLPVFKNAVITIGSFDGVHCGHRKILKKVKDFALANAGESVVITFHPHPRQIVYPKDDSLKLLTTTEEKIALLESCGIDHLVIVPFTFEFSQLTADEYIQRFLVERFHPTYIVIGYDHRFGLNRRGDINYLKWHEKSGGYKVIEIDKEAVDSITVSSTRIREALESGDAQRAATYMEHYYMMTGKVVRGSQIGTSIGFPTANLQIREPAKLIPPDGIYAAYTLVEGVRYRSMLYIGKRPTIQNDLARTIEVHIFDFNQVLYNTEISVEVVAYVRPDAKLDSLEALKSQLQQDKAAVLAVLEKADIQVRKWENRKKPSVGIVILNYNGKSYLEKFLPALLQTTYRNFTVYVADNASKDDSVAFVKSNFPQISIIELGKNFGFSKGYNLALEHLEPDYFVLMNSDVKVSPDWLQPLIKIMEKDRQVAAVQPKILSLNQEGYFEYAGAAGGWIDFLGYPFCRGRIFDTVEQDRGQYDQEQEIFWASGCCLAIRAPLFKGFGGFDEDFFAHLEEIDLCWRLKRAGYKIKFTPRSVVWHVGGGTLGYDSPYKTYLNFRNSYYTLLKNEAILKLSWLLPLRIIMDIGAAVYFLAQGRWMQTQAVFGAFLSFFLGLVTFIRKRYDLELMIERLRISPQPNLQGRLPGIIAFEYFVLQKKTFKKL